LGLRIFCIYFFINDESVIVVWTEFLLALQFLTRLPVTVSGVVDDRTMARSMAYYSLIGLLIGGGAAGVRYLLGLVFSATPANLGAIIFVIFVTGNLHGDGLMDTADGIFSGRSRERMLEIMKDSRVGSHGLMAGVLDLLLRLVLLGEMEPAMQITALLLAPTLGRWVLVYGSARYPYARNSGGTGSFTVYVGWRELLYNSVVALGVTLGFLRVPGLILLVVALVAAFLLHRFIKGRLGGVTGDTLGAAGEVVEILTLAVLVVLPSLISNVHH